MEEVKIQEESKQERVRQHYLLQVKTFGGGVSPRRRIELAKIRKAVVVDRPADMSESDALLIALNRLSERDLKDPRIRYRLVK